MHVVFAKLIIVLSIIFMPTDLMAETSGWKLYPRDEKLHPGFWPAAGYKSGRDIFGMQMTEREDLVEIYISYYSAELAPPTDVTWYAELSDGRKGGEAFVMENDSTRKDWLDRTHILIYGDSSFAELFSLATVLVITMNNGKTMTIPMTEFKSTWAKVVAAQ